MFTSWPTPNANTRALPRRHPECLGERYLEIGAAVGLEPIDPAGRLAQLGVLGAPPALALGAHRVTERHQPEAVARIKRLEQSVDRVARLSHLLPSHGARDVHHDRHVTGLRRRLVHEARRHREHEVAGLADRPVARHGQPHAGAGPGQEDRELTRELVHEAHDQSSPPSLALQSVCGREGIEEAVALLDHHLEVRACALGIGAAFPWALLVALAPPRRGAAQWSRRRSVGLAATHTPGIAEMEGVTRGREQLGVPELHAPLLSGIDRERARAQQAVTGQLNERRVGTPAYDLLVDVARPLPVHDLAP